MARQKPVRRKAVRRKRGLSGLGSMTDDSLFIRIAELQDQAIEMREFLEESIKGGDCGKAYDDLWGSIREDGLRDAFLTAISQRRETANYDQVAKAHDRNADIWEHLMEQNDIFRKKCLRTASELPLKSRFAKRRKAP